jgi:nitrite reductase (NO-forming)
VHVAVLGWIGLAVLSTLTTLWPIVLATRITAGTERLTRASLWPLVAGLVVLTAGLLTGWTVLAVVGLPGYAVGVDILLIPFLRTLRPRTSPHPGRLDAGRRHQVAAGGARSRLGRAADRAQGPAGPGGLLAGFAVQVLTVALSFLLTPTLAGSPEQRRMASAALQQAWVPRVPRPAGCLTNMPDA